MAGEIAKRDTNAEIVANIVLNGDLSRLKPEDKVAYYNGLCERLGLNPLTRPFQYLRLSGKEVLYATKDASEQLRKINGVSITDIKRDTVGDVCLVTVHGQDATGRTDVATGAVTVGNLKGDSLANALMKAETKAKRRLTLSICGLGILDETEIETIPDARPIKVIQAEREIPDLDEARKKLYELIERYRPFLSEQYLNSVELDMDSATMGNAQISDPFPRDDVETNDLSAIEKLRAIYLDVKREGTKAEREAEGDHTKKSRAAKAKPTQLADEAEPVLPDGKPVNNDLEPDDHADEPELF